MMSLELVTLFKQRLEKMINVNVAEIHGGIHIIFRTSRDRVNDEPEWLHQKLKMRPSGQSDQVAGVFQHQAHLPTASSLFINESGPRNGQSTPTPSQPSWIYVAHVAHQAIDWSSMHGPLQRPGLTSHQLHHCRDCSSPFSMQ